MSKLKKRMLKIRKKMRNEDLCIDNDLKYAEAETKYIESFDDMKFEETTKRQMANKRAPRILTLFTREQRVTIKKIITNMREPNLNKRAQQIKDLLGPEFPELGTGTNRIAFLKDGYAIKIALDDRGLKDNMSEYKRAPEAPEYLAKTYETNGIILIAEYVTLFDQTEFENNKDALKTILENLSQKYIMKDLGLTSKNYCNWGYRDNGTIVSLDYAYMYPIRGNENALRCNCGSLIIPNKTFTGYECSNSKCGLKYSAMEITAKIRMDLTAEEDREIIEIANATGENKYVKVEGASIETTSSAIPFNLDIDKPIDELIDDAFNAICKSSSATSNVELVRRFKGLMRELEVTDKIAERWKSSKFDDLDIQIRDISDDAMKMSGKSLIITNSSNGLSEEYVTDPDDENSFTEVKKTEDSNGGAERPSLLKAMDSGLDDIEIDDSDAEKRAQKILEALSDEKDQMDRNISIDEWMGVTSLYNQMIAEGKSDDE